jgi:recombination protein RecT
MGNETIKNTTAVQKADAQDAKIVLQERTIADVVQNRVNELVKGGRLDLPSNYSLGNAMSSAWLILQTVVDKDKKPALQVCTKESIVNALLDMAILGLNPAKQQGYFIVYGNQLTWFTSYFGNQTAISRVKGYEDLPRASLIYDGDTVELGHDEFGEELITKHETTWENKLKSKIVGAYATIKFNGHFRCQVMTMNEILEAWTMSKTNKEHKTFTGEFAKRTVLNRLMKNILKTSTDDDVVAETMIRTENEHFEFSDEQVVETVKKNVEQQTASQEPPKEEIPQEKPHDEKSAGQTQMELQEDKPAWTQ